MAFPISPIFTKTIQVINVNDACQSDFDSTCLCIVFAFTVRNVNTKFLVLSLPVLLLKKLLQMSNDFSQMSTIVC